MDENRRQHDWKKARRLFEIEGLSLAEIGRRIGCKAQTVAAHRDLSGWNRRPKIGAEAAEQAVGKIADSIVRETAPAIIARVQEQEAQRLLALRINRRHLEGLLGGGDPEESSVVLRRCVLNIGTLSGADAGDGSSGDGSGATAEADEAAVRAALADLAGDEPASSRPSAEGEVPD